MILKVIKVVEFGVILCWVLGLDMEVSIDGEGTCFHFCISETKRDFD